MEDLSRKMHLISELDIIYLINSNEKEIKERLNELYKDIIENNIKIEELKDEIN